ncbi:MAG: antitoxin family protein [Cyanobacteria bacterium P01_F01_bin.150]
MQQRLEAIYENGQFRPLQTPNVTEGQAVQIIISAIVPQTQIDLMDTTTDVDAPVPFQPASGRSLLRHAGTWVGDDFEECLQSVYTSRSQTNFSPEEIETVE